MRFDLRGGIMGLSALMAAHSLPAQDTEIELLRAELADLRQDYELRIGNLERRLAIAEQDGLETPAPAPADSLPENTPRSGNAAFNPAIGVIFEGQAWNHSRNPEGYEIPGFPLGGEAGPKPEGLAIGETEIDISANVDDKFTAWLTTPIVIEDGESTIEIEEAWIETLGLPAGLSMRFGRFFSGVGYLNDKHAHSWDFADQPLAYQALLGDQYIDDGAQMRWIAPTRLYFELGAELLRGARYPAAGAEQSGRGAHSVYLNLGGDFGASNSWLAGISYLDAKASDRPSGDEDDPLIFNGDSETAIAEFIWKWAPNGNWRQRNLVFQTEYVWTNERGSYAIGGMAPLAYDNDREGWYAQAVYQAFPSWRFGTRIDTLSMDDPGLQFAGTPLAPGPDDPRRYSLMMDWSNSEFSRVRLQYTRDESGLGEDSQWGLQYLHSIGAHGAHTF